MQLKRHIRSLGTLLLVGMAGHLPTAAQAQNATNTHHRYQLIDIGTFGGPNSGLNGPSTIDISNRGIYIGSAETNTPEPYAPNCQNSECLVDHAQRWEDGRVTDLGALPGVN